MALNYQYGSDISQAIQNLLLGRVLIAANASVADTELTVGAQDGTARPYEGFHFFLDNTTSCTLVQPSAANVPDGIEHSEDVTIHSDTFSAANYDPATIQLSAAITKAYTTARGAYIRMKTPPAVSSAIQSIEHDFITSESFAPSDKWFPGVLVARIGLDHMDYTSGQIKFNYGFRVYYCDTLLNETVSTNNSDKLWDATEVLRDLILEDPHLAGTAHDANVGRMLPWFSTDAYRQGRRFITATDGLQVGWIQFDVFAERVDAWAKHMGA